MVEKSEDVVRVIKTTAAGWHCEGGRGRPRQFNHVRSPNGSKENKSLVALIGSGSCAAHSLSQCTV